MLMLHRGIFQPAWASVIEGSIRNAIRGSSFNVRAYYPDPGLINGVSIAANRPSRHKISMRIAGRLLSDWNRSMTASTCGVDGRAMDHNVESFRYCQAAIKPGKLDAFTSNVAVAEHPSLLL